jgi:primosomal protein N' (replication factor Y)
LGFPPFSRLFRVVIRSKDGSKCREAAESLASLIAGRAGPETSVLGPAECPLSVISGNHRFQIILKTTAFSVTHGVLSASVREFQKPSSVYLEIDVDPVNLL